MQAAPKMLSMIAMLVMHQLEEGDDDDSGTDDDDVDQDLVRNGDESSSISHSSSQVP